MGYRSRRGRATSTSRCAIANRPPTSAARSASTASKRHGGEALVSTLIRNATILTMNDARDVVQGSVSVRDGRIAAVGGDPSDRHDAVIDAAGAYLLPGFIQTHVHLC